jgi:hypothetical protein
VDSELLYSYARINNLGEIDAFLHTSHQANLQSVGDRWVVCFRQRLPAVAVTAGVVGTTCADLALPRSCPPCHLSLRLPGADFPPLPPPSLPFTRCFGLPPGALTRACLRLRGCCLRTYPTGAAWRARWCGCTASRRLWTRRARPTAARHGRRCVLGFLGEPSSGVKGL